MCVTVRSIPNGTDLRTRPRAPRTDFPPVIRVPQQLEMSR